MNSRAIQVSNEARARVAKEGVVLSGSSVGYERAKSALYAACKAFAYAGGFILIGMVLMIVASVIGRGVFSRPVPGDFELIELGSAAVVMLFLPYCQMVRGNVCLDLVAHRMSPGMLRITDAVGNFLLAVVSAVLVWRSVLGGIDLYRSGDSTSILHIPLWTVFPIIVACFLLLMFASLFNLATDLKGERG